MKNVLLTSILVATLGACGGGAPPEGATTPTSSGKHVEHHDEHHDLAPAVKEFHDVLSPLWHMGKGPDQTAKTCAQIATLRERANATADKELVAATNALAAECDKEGRPEFMARFHVVHERFHKIAE